MKHLLVLLLIIISTPTIGAGVEVTDSFSNDFVRLYDGIFCKDYKFTACVGISKNSCSEHIAEVLNGCDIRSVRNEIVKKGENGPNSEKMMEFWECFSSRFSEQFSLGHSDFMICYTQRMEKYMGVKKRNTEDKL